MKKIAHILVPILAIIFIISGCKEKQAEQKPTPPSVTVNKPESKEVTPYLYESGNAVSANTIDLVARVSGYLESYNFTDGSMVNKGDLLFVIQPEPYANDLAQAQAQLDSSIAEYTYDETEYKRQLSMYQRKATSLSDVQQWKSKTESSAAEVQSAQANLENAGITYSYTRVFAPINGRIGRHLVDPGNLVGSGEATELASIEQISPIYVYFNINELDLLKIREIAKKANFKLNKIRQIPVEAALQNQNNYTLNGQLDFASTNIDSSTGTIQMRAILPNQKEQILPGYFVNLRIALGQPKEELTVPSAAIMHDQIGPYVFTVDMNQKVQETRVETGSTDENGDTAVLKGLMPSSLVITSGLQNATPGIEVKATEKLA